MIKRLVQRDQAAKITQALAFKIIKYPYLTEKSAKLSKVATVTLEVDINSNKCEIKRAFELIFQAKPLSVNTHIKPGKTKQGGKVILKDKKMAIIKVEKSADISKIIGVAE